MSSPVGSTYSTSRVNRGRNKEENNEVRSIFQGRLYKPKSTSRKASNGQKHRIKRAFESVAKETISELNTSNGSSSLTDWIQKSEEVVAEKRNDPDYQDTIILRILKTKVEDGNPLTPNCDQFFPLAS